VLVLDLYSAKFISSLFTITELVGQGIVFIERLEKVRKSLDHHAIYFITPTEQSIECMLKDYNDEDKCKYRKAHVLLSSALDRSLMKKIASNKLFLKKLARHSFKEFYFEVSVISDNCVHLSIDYLSLAFSRESN
jgi:syntaxin-binding protein 1